MPGRSAPAWTGISPAIAARWPSSGSRPRPRRWPAASAASARALSRERVRLTLRGKGLARLRGLSLPAQWWQERIFPKLELPDDLRAQLASWQRILLPIDAELSALTVQLQEAAPAQLPSFLGAMTWELLRREVGDWGRFRNRRQVASYTGLCPASIPPAAPACRAASPATATPASATCWSRPPGGSCATSPTYRAVAKWREAFLASP
jgi:hypothetical protein